QEVVSLPFSSESQETISKNSSSYFMNIVLVIRSWQGNTVYSEEGIVIRHLSQSFFQIQYKYFVKK
ncbi:hypothetical protein, partial [Enterococcus faecium]|uniref:hypothetical protein n=1 Tax=Enterococcus faecium TaxID=1352 RepID=UPI001CC0CCAE